MPLRKLLKAFGPPLEGPINSGEDYSYSDWYLNLKEVNSNMNKNELVISRSGSEDTKDNDDETLQFVIKANGEDTDLVTGLAAYCTVNGIVQQPEKYSFKFPEQRMVVVDVVHHASITEYLLEYLEYALDGIAFLTHYDFSNKIITEDDDQDMLYYSKRSCTHPICGYDADDGLLTDFERSVERYDAEQKINDNINHNSYIHKHGYKAGQGTLVGIDLEVMADCVVLAENYDESEDFGAVYDIGNRATPPNIREYLRPLQERLHYFIGDTKSLTEAIQVFNAINKQLNGSIAGGSSVDGDGDSDHESAVQKGRRSFDTEKLDQEYEHANVKIADLGIYLHSTVNSGGYIFIFIVLIFR